jgi:hypothetical protein
LGQAYGLGLAPPSDAGVIARSQYFGDFEAPEFGGFGEMGVFQQSLGERLLFTR